MRPTNYAAIVLVAIVAGCAGLRWTGPFRPSPVDWTSAGGSPSRANRTSETLRTPLSERWTYNAQGGILATPLVRDSIVIIATMHGELQAVQIANGKRIGYSNIGGPVRGTPLLDREQVIIPISTLGASLVCYDLNLGKPTWSAKLGPIECSPVAAGSRVVVATLEGRLIALDHESGEELWRYAPGNEDARKPFRASPAYVDPVVVCGSDDGTLYAVDPATGTLRWKRATAASFFAGPAGDSGVVVAANLAGEILACAVTDGALKWSAALHVPVYGSPSIDQGTVYIAASDGKVHAFALNDGTERWVYQAASVINVAPLIAGETVVFGALDRSLTVLDRRSGNVLWQTMLEGRVKVPAVVWKGTLLIAFEDKSVTAFSALEGS